MNNNELQAGTKDEQRTAAESGTSASLVQNGLLNAVAVVLKEPNHLDYKVKNKYDEWVWKSPYAMNRYADDWEQWYNQERQEFKEKHGLSDEELNYRGEQAVGEGKTQSNMHPIFNQLLSPFMP